jgi:hypothetical protein
LPFDLKVAARLGAYELATDEHFVRLGDAQTFRGAVGVGFSILVIDTREWSATRAANQSVGLFGFRFR